MPEDDEEKTVRITDSSQRNAEIRAAAWELVDRFVGPEPAHPDSQAIWRRDCDRVRETIREELEKPDFGRSGRKLELTPHDSNAEDDPDRGPEIFRHRHRGPRPEPEPEPEPEREPDPQRVQEGDSYSHLRGRGRSRGWGL